MTVRKFCACGVKLEKTVSDEETARQVVTIFRLEHSGAGHGPITRAQYERLIQSIIKRNTSRKGQPRESFNQRRLRTFRVITGGRK
jgi:hypothetical protein